MFGENGRGAVGLGRGGDVIFPCDCCETLVASEDGFVVIVLVPDVVTVACVVETSAAATRDPGDTASYVELDLA